MVRITFHRERNRKMKAEKIQFQSGFKWIQMGKRRSEWDGIDFLQTWTVLVEKNRKGESKEVGCGPTKQGVKSRSIHTCLEPAASQM